MKLDRNYGLSHAPHLDLSRIYILGRYTVLTWFGKKRKQTTQRSHALVSKEFIEPVIGLARSACNQACIGTDA